MSEKFNPVGLKAFIELKAQAELAREADGAPRPEITHPKTARFKLGRKLAAFGVSGATAAAGVVIMADTANAATPADRIDATSDADASPGKSDNRTDAVVAESQRTEPSEDETQSRSSTMSTAAPERSNITEERAVAADKDSTHDEPTSSGDRASETGTTVDKTGGNQPGQGEPAQRPEIPSFPGLTAQPEAPVSGPQEQPRPGSAPEDKHEELLQPNTSTPPTVPENPGEQPSTPEPTEPESPVTGRDEEPTPAEKVPSEPPTETPGETPTDAPDEKPPAVDTPKVPNFRPVKFPPKKQTSTPVNPAADPDEQVPDEELPGIPKTPHLFATPIKARDAQPESPDSSSEQVEIPAVDGATPLESGTDTPSELDGHQDTAGEVPPVVVPESPNGYYIAPEAPNGEYIFGPRTPGNERSGSRPLIDAVIKVAKDWYRDHPEEKLVIGDLNAELGHASHKTGNDVDITTLNRRAANINGDTEMTKDLVRRLADTNVIEIIFHNDREVIDFFNNYVAENNLSGEMQWWEGHEYHLHVRVQNEYALARASNTPEGAVPLPPEYVDAVPPLNQAEAQAPPVAAPEPAAPAPAAAPAEEAAPAPPAAPAAAPRALGRVVAFATFQSGESSVAANKAVSPTPHRFATPVSFKKSSAPAAAAPANVPPVATDSPESAPSQAAENLNPSGLLETIAKGESRGNYNAYYGNTNNSEIDFTSMSIGDVLEWQKDFIRNGSPSSAVGRYQFVQSTLNGLVEVLGVDRNARFDHSLQDKLAVELLERRGLQDYLAGNISKEQFAHNLSKEWAALPRVIGGQPHESYYAGDGLNSSRISPNEILTAIDSLRLSPIEA